jgi:hypothetical protein
MDHSHADTRGAAYAAAAKLQCICFCSLGREWITYRLGREEPGKTIESERFLQHTDPEFTIRIEYGARRSARGAGEGEEKQRAGMLPRWAGGSGGGAGERRRLRGRKTMGTGEGERPAASATSPPQRTRY